MFLYSVSELVKHSCSRISGIADSGGLFPLTGPFTILAPRNAAIRNLDPDILAALAREPALVQQVVKFHIIHDYLVLPELFKSEWVSSMEGQPIHFTGSISVRN